MQALYPGVVAAPLVTGSIAGAGGRFTIDALLAGFSALDGVPPVPTLRTLCVHSLHQETWWLERCCGAWPRAVINTLHQPHLYQPWRLDRCNPFTHSLPCARCALCALSAVSGALLMRCTPGWLLFALTRERAVLAWGTLGAVGLPHLQVMLCQAAPVALSCGLAVQAGVGLLRNMQPIGKM